MRRVALCKPLLLIAPFHVPPVGSAAAADISVDISGAYIVGSIDSAITEFIETAPGLAWDDDADHVQAFPADNPASLHIRLRLTYALEVEGSPPLIIPIQADMDLVFDCDQDGPIARIEQVDIATLVPVPDEVEEVIEAAGNVMLEEQTAEIVEPIWDKLEEADIANVRQVCPHFRVGSDASIHAEVDFVRGCINGDTGHRECSTPRYYGPGRDYVCVNGYWQFRWGWCEPAAPPGGQRP